MQDAGSECKSMIGCEFLPIGKTPQTPNPAPHGPTNSLFLNSYRYFSLLCSQWRWIWDCPTCHRRHRSPPNFLRDHFCSPFHFPQTFSPHFLPLVFWLFFITKFTLQKQRNHITPHRLSPSKIVTSLFGWPHRIVLSVFLVYSWNKKYHPRWR